MKLLSTDLSPFAARVRAQIYTKGLNSQGMRIKIEEPDPPLRSEGFKASYALGKVPVLILDDDSHIGESWVIMNYLEDLYPETNLRPHHPLDKAYMGLFQAFADNHLRDQLFPLFAMLMNPDAGGDTDAAIKSVSTEFAKFDRQLDIMPTHTNRTLHIGDIALAMPIYFALAVPAVFGATDLLSKHENLNAWWDWVQTHNGVAKAITEIDTAFKAFG